MLPSHRRKIKFFLHRQPLVSLLHPFPPVVLVMGHPPCRLCPVSFVTANFSPLPLFPFRHQQGFPVANHRIYNHIENGGWQCVSLSNPSLSAEGCSLLPSRSRHHLQPCPILLQEAKVPRFHTITLQDTQALGPIQGIGYRIQKSLKKNVFWMTWLDYLRIQLNEFGIFLWVYNDDLEVRMMKITLKNVLWNFLRTVPRKPYINR